MLGSMLVELAQLRELVLKEQERSSWKEAEFKALLEEYNKIAAENADLRKKMRDLTRVTRPSYKDRP